MHKSNEGHAGTLRAEPGGAGARQGHDAERLGEAVPRDRRRPLWQSVTRLGGLFPASGSAHPDAGALLHRGGDPSRSGRADGRLIRAARSKGGVLGPRFDEDIPAGGYSWWYIDAISEDGQHGLTIIAFVGSVFSPYYKRSGRAAPLDHSCLNVALYGPKSRWVMTERPGGALARSRSELAIGPSEVRWNGDALEITIEERDTRLFNPIHRRVRGTVRVIPESLNPASFALDAGENHIWHCMAPRARIEVAMEEPGVAWTGQGYFDHNRGREPLEQGFNVWHWSRAHMRRGAVVCYEGERGDGSLFASAIRFDREGRAEDAELPPIARLPRSKWQVERRARSEISVARVRRTWEDTPFYARSELSSHLDGEEVVSVQESLDLRRFASPIVQFMLPYRMPRKRV